MTQSIPAAQYRQMTAKKANKYGAKRTVLDGITFDSKAEAAYYAALKLREKAGEVVGVEVHKPFELLGTKGELICVYKCDFAYWDSIADRFRVIDVKGVETKEFKLKKRLMRILKGIEVEVVKA